MNTSPSEVGGAFITPDAFVGSGVAVDATPGVASLDSPALQQTKSEIRSLAGELAQLAHMALEPGEFYAGFLPRLCAAMGAKGAGVWRINSRADLDLIASHSLPPILIAESANAAGELARSPFSETTHDGEIETCASSCSQPSEAHQRILQCAVAEGQPILVPPGDVTLEMDRPTNPLSDSIIIIPIRPEENVEFLLEVVQRPSGGPAAQRGYLRFVAQMGDLMADYLRRQQLRQMTGERRRLERIEGWLTTVAAARNSQQRQQAVADALQDLFTAERVILINQGWRGQVVAISGSQNFDSRSEIVLAALTLHGHYYQQQHRRGQASIPEINHPPGWFQATNRRQSQPPQEDNTRPHLIPQDCVDQLCEASACRQGVFLPIGRQGYWSAILIYGEETTNPQPGFDDQESPQFRLLQTLAALLENAGAGAGWLASSGMLTLFGMVGGHQKLVNHRSTIARRVQQWFLRLTLVGLICAIALFPVSQPISATAILQPLSKQMYYAPAAGIVAEVFVDEGDAVDNGALLLRLTSHELETQAEDLQIKIKKTQGQLAEKTSQLNRGETLSALEKDQLEFQQRELETTLQSLELQKTEISERLSELSVSARRSGTVSTWDLQNRLLNHPVQAGQLLASTFDPDDKWRLELSIPDHRAGLVADALANSEQGAIPVQFSLTSHPDRILEAFVVNMAPQVTVQHDATVASRVVKTEAFVPDTSTLPLKKDGAIARASIDCGKVPLIWLVFRDAYWAISSRVRMMW